MTDLIYLLGAGRCGSTLIERILATAPGVTAVGELHALWRLPHDDLLCTCGARVPDCPFWTEALTRARIGPATLAHLRRLEAEVIRTPYLARLRFDPARLRADRRLQGFAAIQARLFAGIRAASGARVVIDSSKASPRARVLAAHLDPTVVHLHRNARDVLASWCRPKHEPATGRPMASPALHGAALDWVKAETTARAIATARLEYERFVQDPRFALKQALNNGFDGLTEAIPWTGPDRVPAPQMYHSVLGNPDRFSRAEIIIRPRHASDRARFGRMEQMVLTALGGTLDRIWR